MRILAAFIFLFANCAIYAQLSLPKIFQDHMVMQRSTNIPIWGEAEPGTKITLIMANTKAETITDEQGKWMARLPEFKPGGPYILRIFENENKKPSIVFNDVLIGDVWLASGQSNMEWQVQQSDGAAEEIATAKNKNIRFFQVEHDKSLVPLSDIHKGKWTMCDSNNVKKYSAVAYYFAKETEVKENIPVGIIQSTWGGTPIEAWTSREMLLSEPISRKRINQNDSITEKHFKKDSLDLIHFWDIVYNPKNGMDTIVPKIDFQDSKWEDIHIPGFVRDYEPEFYEGMVWLRKRISLNQDFQGKELTINLGIPEMNYSLYFNGKEICKTIWNANLTHTYKIPSSIVKEGDNIISLRIAALWGGGGLNPPKDSIYLSNGTAKLPLTGKWKYKKDLEDKIPKIHNYHYYPTYLFNAMINPLIPYSLKGFLWYQGEANEEAAYNYRNLLPLLINDWRIRWKQGFLPFLFVQLPNYMKTEQHPSDGTWAVMRESQATALNLPNTGMACIIDIGEENNIHPTNKKEVGVRLANIAQNIVYKKNLLSSGPVYKSHVIENGKVTVRFNNTGKGLNTSDSNEVKGFALAGEDKKYYWADAEIRGNEVILSSKDVPNPIAVRYAWANNPICNLINSEGLPALPFRTDCWKVVTE